jgi:hypothetical protein
LEDEDDDGGQSKAARGTAGRIILWKNVFRIALAALGLCLFALVIWTVVRRKTDVWMQRYRPSDLVEFPLSEQDWQCIHHGTDWLTNVVSSEPCVSVATVSNSSLICFRQIILIRKKQLRLFKTTDVLVNVRLIESGLETIGTLEEATFWEAPRQCVRAKSIKLAYQTADGGERQAQFFDDDALCLQHHLDVAAGRSTACVVTQEGR